MSAGPPRPSRRLVLGAGLGAVATAAACSAGPPTGDPTPSTGSGSVAPLGLVGDGVTDNAAAFERALVAGPRGGALNLPAGVFRVSRMPDLPDFTTVTGAGADLTTLLYDGADALIDLRGRHRVAFARLGVFVTGTQGTAVRLRNCFRCSFESVVMRGNHTAAGGGRFHAQRGIVLEENTGGTALINCDVNNFGVGLTTSCIQNYVTASKFTSNRIGVLGTGDDHNAGLSLANVEFVSDANPATTEVHLRVDGAANDWFLTNCWFEGCDTAIDLGRRDVGGPAQFGLVNAKLAARHTAIRIAACRQPYLANVSFDADTGRTAGPRALEIDAAGCPQGTAVNLISGTEDEVELELFPPGWDVTARHGRRGGTILSPMTMRAPSVADSVSAAPVLRDARGGYWQLAVDEHGGLTTNPLGSPPAR